MSNVTPGPWLDPPPDAASGIESACLGCLILIGPVIAAAAILAALVRYLT